MLPARGLHLLAIFLFALTSLVVLGLRRGLVHGVCTRKLIHHGQMWAPADMTPLTNHSYVHSSHIYREDGMLVVNPDAPHPIFDIINRAEARWHAKLGSASRTLEEAVSEYIRRYRRAPPKGFDAWWRYAELHNVQLPDEYDQIWSDLEPFWGMDPVDLNRLQLQHEGHIDSFTLGKNEGESIKLLNVSVSDPSHWEDKNLLRGAEDILDLLQDVQHHLPPFRAVVSPHDNPTLFSDFDSKSLALKAASKHSYLNLSNIVPDQRIEEWSSACAPSSPARQSKRNATLSSRKTFIHHHHKTMDPCTHPQLLEIHGEFLSHSEPTAQSVMIPRFAYAPTTLHHDIRIPTLLSWVDDIVPQSDNPPWEGRLDESLSWRGSNTGMWHAPETRWRNAQRARLVDFSRNLNGTFRVLIPSGSREARVGEGVEIGRQKINPAMMDITFAGAPIGCPPLFCDELLHMFEWRQRQNPKEAGNFKYVIDVDGNAWSSRFKRLMTSNSLIFKATIYPEWFLDRIEPWVHYVPVQVDYSDLYDLLTFFRGGMYGEGANDDTARKIATAGRTWSKSFWRKEDITAYLFRLFLEYARVMSLDRDAMSYVMNSST